MPLLEADRSLVLVIDMQGDLVHQVHRSAFMLAATHRLLEIADLFEVPVLLTEQYPRGLGATTPELLGVFENLATAHQKVKKTSFSCCGAPSFELALEKLMGGVDVAHQQLVIAGIEAHVCVVQTVLGLVKRGCDVHLCWECVSSRGAEYRNWAIDRMRQAGAAITNHESVGFEWARDKDHPSFRGLNRLLRAGQIVDAEGG